MASIQRVIGEGNRGGDGGAWLGNGELRPDCRPSGSGDGPKATEAATEAGGQLERAAKRKKHRRGGFVGLRIDRARKRTQIRRLSDGEAGEDAGGTGRRTKLDEIGKIYGSDSRQQGMPCSETGSTRLDRDRPPSGTLMGRATARREMKAEGREGFMEAGET